MFKGAITKYADKEHIVFQRQPRYHDHIIKNEHAYHAIKKYIKNNPKSRKDDMFYG